MLSVFVRNIRLTCSSFEKNSFEKSKERSSDPKVSFAVKTHYREIKKAPLCRRCSSEIFETTLFYFGEYSIPLLSRLQQFCPGFRGWAVFRRTRTRSFFPFAFTETTVPAQTGSELASPATAAFAAEF